MPTRTLRDVGAGATKVIRETTVAAAVAAKTVPTVGAAVAVPTAPTVPAVAGVVLPLGSRAAEDVVQAALASAGVVLTIARRAMGIEAWATSARSTIL